jgi:PAS domain S-box-containing protein
MRLKFSLDPYYTKSSLLSSTPVVILIIVLLYGIFKEGSIFFLISLGKISPIFPVTGFCFALTLIYGQKALVQIFIGSFLAGIHPVYPLVNNLNQSLLLEAGYSFLGAVGFVLANALSTFTVIKLCKKKNPLYSGLNVIYLLIVGTFIYCSITSMIGLLIITLEGQIDSTQFFYVFSTWFLGDAIGIIIFTPFVLVWYFNDYLKKDKFNIYEFILSILAVIIVFVFIFLKKPTLTYLLIPLFLWFAYRFGMRYTTITLVVLSLSTFIITNKGIGPFVENSLNDSFLLLDLFLSTITICSLCFAAFLEERYRAEQAIIVGENLLHKNQDILQTTIESPKDTSIYSVGRNYEYISFNSLYSKSIKQMSNVTIAIGMKIQDCILNPKELSDTLEQIDKAFLGESITTIRFFESNNSFWELKSSPIKDKNNKIIGVTLFSSNIDERIKSQEALKKSEEKYRSIFENVQDIFFQTDIAGTILELSPSIQQQLDFSKEELIGQSVNSIYNDLNDRVEFIRSILKNGSIKDFEVKINTKFGIQKHVSIDARLIYDNNGKPHHIDGFVRDISTRKASELKISKQNIKLQIQNKELEQFAYITSHDLQEPLLTLKCFSELIKEEFPKDINEGLDLYLNFILESSDRMQKLIKGLQDYSRIGNQIETTKIESNKIVNEVVLSLSDSIKEANALISISNLPEIIGNSSELFFLFQELITNAIKFRKNEVQLKIHIESKLIDNNWFFSITDNGIGINENDKEKTFVIFKRLNNREDFPGIGIGLALCKKIVALYGGDIWVESTLGQGSTINFTMPKN